MTTPKGRRGRRILMLCLGTVLVISHGPARAADEDCRPGKRDIVYTTDKAVAVFNYDLSSCDPDGSTGSMSASISLQRGNEEPVVVSEECPAGTYCYAEASIPHGRLESAHYRAVWDFRSNGSVIRGWQTIDTPCNSFVVVAGCPWPFAPEG